MGTSRVPPKPLPMPLRPALSCLLLAAASLAAAPSHAQPATTGAGAAALVPEAEHSGFQRTGRYEEVARLAAAFQARYPDQVQARSFGTTPEGRPMQLLVVTATGAFDPAEAKRRGLPVVLVQGGIHAGEIDGKDAGFLALRQVLEGQAAPGALDKLVWLFVPVFNVDGFERFGRWNRPNQRGPEQTGWRTTAQNFNLNRDYVRPTRRKCRRCWAWSGNGTRWLPSTCTPPTAPSSSTTSPSRSNRCTPATRACARSAAPGATR